MLGAMFAFKGVFTAASALAVMIILPWVTASLRTAVSESGATIPPVLAWTLERTWILHAIAAVAPVSGVCMVATRRGRWIHLAISTLALAGLVIFLALCFMALLRSVTDAATGF
jgi:hypothetical protein